MNNLQFIDKINDFFTPENLYPKARTLLDLLVSDQLQKDLYLLKIIYLSFALLLIPLIIYFLARSTFLQAYFLYDLIELITFRPFGLKRYEKEWKKIIDHLEVGTEDAFKLAIIEADNLMAQLLKRMEIPGKDMSERLANATESQIPNLSKLREAHKLRDDIVHDPSLTITLEKAREVLAIYEKTLRDLELL